MSLTDYPSIPVPKHHRCKYLRVESDGDYIKLFGCKKTNCLCIENDNCKNMEIEETEISQKTVRRESIKSLLKSIFV